jgi:predicted site-specific integrase-resolvase
MYLRKKEVADLLRVTVRTVTSYMQHGLIPNPKKVGKILLWDEVELQRSLDFCSKPQLSAHVPRGRGRPRKILST